MVGMKLGHVKVASSLDIHSSGGWPHAYIDTSTAHLSQGPIVQGSEARSTSMRYLNWHLEALLMS